MSVSLDCRDGQHIACASSGGCCCSCHSLEQHNGYDHCPGCQAEYQARSEWAQLVGVWDAPASSGRRTRARHAARPRLKTLMSGALDELASWGLIVAVGVGIGVLIAIVVPL
jgi:hypothetical protein